MKVRVQSMLWKSKFLIITSSIGDHPQPLLSFFASRWWRRQGKGGRKSTFTSSWHASYPSANVCSSPSSCRCARARHFTWMRPAKQQGGGVEEWHRWLEAMSMGRFFGADCVAGVPESQTWHHAAHLHADTSTYVDLSFHPPLHRHIDRRDGISPFTMISPPLCV